MTSKLLAPVAFVVTACALLAASLLVPADPWSEVVLATAGGAAVAAVLFGVSRYRPVRTTPWSMFVVGIGCWASAAVLASAATDDRAFPGLPETLVALGFPWMIVGVIGVTSPLRRVRDLLVGSESLIAAITSSTLLWIVLLEPYHADGSIPLSPTVWISAFVIADLTLAALALRGASEVSDERPMLSVIGAAFVVAGVTHGMLGLAEHQGWWQADRWPDVLLMAAPLLVGLAALVPVDLDREPMSLETYTVRWSRVTGLTVAAILPSLVVALKLAIDGSDISRPTIAIVASATVALVLLVVVRIWGMVIQVRELSERRAQVRLAALVEYANDVVMIVDAAGVVVYASPGLLGSLGHDPAHWVGRSVAEIVVVDQRPQFSSEFVSLVQAGRDATVEFETTLLRADGQHRHGDVVMANLLGDEAVDGVVVTVRDITEQRDLERRLSHRAFHDELTGLANRALFLDRMDHALHVRRPDSDPVMVLFIDLDDFKAVNDRHGHDVGDQLLRALAQRVRGATATGDTAARLGGDEFAILLEEQGGIDRAIDLAERLLDSLRTPIRLGGLEIVVLASIGIAVAPAGTSTTSVLRDADIAMYEAKRAGKGQIRIFDPAMRQVAARHLAYRSELATAIASGQMRVVYLPYVDLRSGEVRGAEALVRWRHPEFGEVSPGEFVPIAERTGMMVPIGRWVLGEALDQARGWRRDTDLFVSINVSAAEIREADFVEHLIDAIADRGLDPRTLVVEVTETMLMEDTERATLTVAELREHGVRVALDDFGAGYCSLSFLQRHPVDLIKVDRSVTAEVGHGPEVGSSGNTLARTIVQMSEMLGLQSVAEGIESTGQLRELRSLGCDLGQGHLLSAPLEGPVAAQRFAHPATLAAG